MIPISALILLLKRTLDFAPFIAYAKRSADSTAVVIRCFEAGIGGTKAPLIQLVMMTAQIGAVFAQHHRIFSDFAASRFFFANLQPPLSLLSAVVPLRPPC